LFLEIDANDVSLTRHLYTHTFFDRLGPAARQCNASDNLSLPSPPAPAITDFDLATVNVNTARQPTSTITAQRTRLANAFNSYQALKPLLAAVPTTGPRTASQQLLVQQGVVLAKYLTIAENELVTMGYNATADLLSSQLQTGYYSRIYPDS